MKTIKTEISRLEIKLEKYIDKTASWFAYIILYLIALTIVDVILIANRVLK